MCNLYLGTTNQQAIRDLFAAQRPLGNFAPMPGVYPNYHAPIVRSRADDGGELALFRWGLPPPVL